MEARGYSFAPDDAGIGAELRYQLNNGGCVGTSALFGALLNGDYDEVGYVYVFWLESEHVSITSSRTAYIMPVTLSMDR